MTAEEMKVFSRNLANSILAIIFTESENVSHAWNRVKEKNRNAILEEVYDSVEDVLLSRFPAKG